MNRQKSTFQVPCGEHSIFYALKDREVTPFQSVVYFILTYYSNWETGKTHGMSYTRISELLHVKRPRVIAAIDGLIENGWLEKKVRNKIASAKYNQQTANTYRLIHHKCEPEEVPLDEDGCPKKCAMPRGEGAAVERMFAGEISWQACLYWHVAKLLSNWTSGVVEFTIKTAREWTCIGRDRLYKIRKKLSEIGLLERLSKKFSLASIGLC